MSREAVKTQDFPPEIVELLRNLFKGHSEGFRKFGDAGFVLPASYAPHADALRRMAARPDDTWVVTFPRSGTTLVQEMVWLLEHNLDYEAALRIPLLERYTFIEVFCCSHEQFQNPKWLNLSADQMSEMIEPGYKKVERVPSPRFLKTHLPLSLLPLAVGESCRLVYVARDPRDVAVSYYNLNKLLKMHDFVGDFKSFWELFIADSVAYSPFFGHLKEAWSLRDKPNVLFIFYEDIIKDLPAAVQRVSKFLGKEYAEDDIKKLCEHLGIENFRKNQSISPDFFKSSAIANQGAEPFIRKGVAGGWRAHFDAAMERQAQEWMRRHLADTDLRFPHT